MMSRNVLDHQPLPRQPSQSTTLGRRILHNALPSAKLAGDALLEIESGVVRNPFTIVGQLEVESAYDLRSDLLDLGASCIAP
jgi:hypothetical protein